MSQDELFQVQRPEVGRPTDRRVDSEFLAGRPELRGLRPFDPTRDVDLTDEINRVAANLRAEIASKAVSTPAWAISSTTENPRAPEQEELDANEVIHGSRLTASGAVQPLTWEPHTRMGQWVERGEPTATVADVQATQVVATEAKEVADTAKEAADTAKSVADTAQKQADLAVNIIGRVAVDATYHGVDHGADAGTFMDALSQVSRSGGTLVCPPGVELVHRGGHLHIEDYKNLRIEGRGLRIVADPAMPQSGKNGGFVLTGVRDAVLLDMTYDGRLDVRDSVINDMQPDGGGFQHAWHIGQACDLVELSNCAGLRGMMDAICVGNTPHEFPSKFASSLATRPRRLTLRGFRAEYGYRQAMSFVNVDGLHVIGGTFSRTGALPDVAGQRPKRIPPGAGADGETWLWPADPTGQHDEYNDNVLFEGVTFEENWGNGLMFVKGTRGGKARGCIVRRNGGWGVLFGGDGQKCEFTGGIVQDNATRGIEKSEVVIGQPNAVFRNNDVICGAGNKAVLADYAGGSGHHRILKENRISVLRPTGSPHEGRVEIKGLFDEVEDNRLYEAVGFNNDAYAAFVVDSPGGVVRNNVVQQTTGGTGHPLTVFAAALSDGNRVSGYTPPVVDKTRAARPYDPWLERQAGRGCTISNNRWTDMGGEQGRHTYALDCTIAVDYSDTNDSVKLGLSPESGFGNARPHIRSVSMVNGNDWGQVVTANVTAQEPNAAIVNFSKKDSGTFDARIIVDYVSRVTPQQLDATNWLENGGIGMYNRRPATVSNVQAVAGAATDTTLTYTVTADVNVPVLTDGEMPDDIALALRPGGGNAVIKRITAVSVMSGSTAIPTEPVPGQPWLVRVKLDRTKAYTLAVSVTAEYGMA